MSLALRHPSVGHVCSLVFISCSLITVCFRAWEAQKPAVKGNRVLKYPLVSHSQRSGCRCWLLTEKSNPQPHWGQPLCKCPHAFREPSYNNSQKSMCWLPAPVSGSWSACLLSSQLPAQRPAHPAPWSHPTPCVFLELCSWSSRPPPELQMDAGTLPIAHYTQNTLSHKKNSTLRVILAVASMVCSPTKQERHCRVHKPPRTGFHA